MGQAFGKASFAPSVCPYVNLSSTSIRKLWQSFNLNADGWGINSSLFSTILESLQQGESSAARSAALFLTLDTDEVSE
tara:strand:- start:72 stop:305 length:234 start_codon:yes stop_codon:yes gene_type:complete